MENKTTEQIATFTENEMLLVSNCKPEKEGFVTLVNTNMFVLTGIEKVNALKVVLNGYKIGKGNTKIAIEQIANVRACWYLWYKKSSKVPLFNKAKLEEFLKGATEGVMLPAYECYVNMLIEEGTKIAYGSTFVELMYCNEKAFNTYLKGEQPKIVFPQPFNMGVAEMETKYGKLTANFGLFTGFSAIHIVLPTFAQITISGNHTKSGIPNLVNTIKGIAGNEKLMKAESSKEAQEIYKNMGFKIGF